MPRLTVQPKIEYEQVQGKYYADKVKEAYFILFEEMARLGKLDNLLKKRAKPISTIPTDINKTIKYN